MMNKQLFIDGFVQRIQQHYCLSQGHAFEVLVLAAFLDLSFDEVLASASTLVKGSGRHDAGMDGLYLDEDEHECTLHVFQVKSSQHLGDNELSKFVNDYRNLFVYDNAAQLPLNDRVKAVLEEYKAIVSSGKVVETKLYFVYAGEFTAQNQALVERHQQDTDYLAIYDGAALYDRIDSLLAEHRKRKTVRFSFMAEKSNISLKQDPQALISFQIQNIKALNFRLPALELCKLLDMEKSINKRIDTAFSDNIRGFLRYNKTNKNIRATLESEYAEYFPFLNNGITIIAEQVKIPREMQAGFYPVEARNPVIVNGLQTTHVIYNVYQQVPERLEGVYVLIRLYETDEAELVNRITDATNTQSPINFRDKMSNRDFNIFARALFEMQDIGYLTKRGDTFENSLSLNMQASVHSDVVLKYWYATYNEQPEIAKNAKSKVLEDIFDACMEPSHRLHPLFKGDKDSPVYGQLLTAYRLYRFVTEARENADVSQVGDAVLYADELLTYGIFKLAGDNQDDYPEAYQQAYQGILNAVEEEAHLLQDREMKYSHNAYFKSAKSRYDLNRQLGLVEQR